MKRRNFLKGVIGGEIVPEDLALQLTVALGLGVRRENDISQ